MTTGSPYRRIGQAAVGVVDVVVFAPYVHGKMTQNMLPDLAFCLNNAGIMHRQFWALLSGSPGEVTLAGFGRRPRPRRSHAEPPSRSYASRSHIAGGGGVALRYTLVVEAVGLVGRCRGELVARYVEKRWCGPDIWIPTRSARRSVS